MKKALHWKLGHNSSPDLPPDVMVDASVPGNANLDWITANNLPDWKFGANFEQYKWMEDCWWLYETVIPSISIKDSESLFFVSEGIDYACKILIDGQTVCEHEGMFTPICIALESDKSGILQIWIAPPPKDTLGRKDTRDEAAQTCKPAVSYGWDWHPRLIPSGMWKDAYIEVRAPNRFLNAYVEYELSDDFSSVCVKLISEIEGSGEVFFSLLDPNGKKVLNIVGDDSAEIKNPMLWWCNGYGEPNLYRWEAVLISGSGGKEVDKKTGTVGFRKLEMIMNEGSWDVPKGFPLSRSPVPITISLNGVPVFAKGSNWVNPEIFTGVITRDTYLPLIKLAKEANYNILRCWGGAIINKASFFELCDELGIMVWQDFPLACNDYRETPEYMKILEQEATAIINELRHYACLVLWCGGNELFNSWSKMTDQSLALRLLNKLCFELDPERPFIMTSPLCGMGHGNYMFRYADGREVFQVMPTAQFNAYTEFGVPSVSNLDCIKTFADLADVFPMVRNDVTIAHHAFDAYEGDPACWACLETLTGYFGEPESLDDLIKYSQWLQSEGYKCIYEEARRQKPFCSMALNWCYNEPWPTLANNSIINYPAEPKPSFRAVADACRPVMISARIPKFSWSANEDFSIELFLLNDSPSPAVSGTAIVSVVLSGKSYPLGNWDFNEAYANVNIKGPSFSIKLPDIKVDGFAEMILKIEAGDMSSCYRLLYKG